MTPSLTGLILPIQQAKQGRVISVRKGSKIILICQ